MQVISCRHDLCFLYDTLGLRVQLSFQLAHLSICSFLSKKRPLIQASIYLNR
jgi:hypothetical protein